MFEQNVFQDMQFTNENDYTEAGSVDDSVYVKSKMSKEELQQKTDEEILQMIQKAQGNTGKEFSEIMGCDFSYSYLTKTLRDRGYDNGWHKVSEAAVVAPKPTVIQMKKSDDITVRVSYMLDRSVAEAWKEFNQHVPYKSVTLGFAMKRFMEDVRSGKIKFELEIY